MPTDGWQEVRLGELVRVEHGWPFRSELFSTELTGKPIVVSIGNFCYTGGFRFESTEAKEYRGEFPKQFELKPRDILVVMTCQTPGGEILGVPARVPDDGRTYLHNQRMGKIARLRPDLIEDHFLYYLFLWRELNQELLASSTGTKIIHTAPSRIEAFRFPLPPRHLQKGIGCLLATIDSAIDQNTKITRTIEELARSLFKSWFVDFEPVQARCDNQKPVGVPESGIQLFPQHFERSGNGAIPRGWSFQRIGAVVADLFDGPHATPSPADEGPLFLGIRNLPGTRIDLTEIRHISEQEWPRWTQRVTPHEGDIVFSYEATIGHFAIIPPALRCCLGRRVALVRPKRIEHTDFLFSTFVSEGFQELLVARSNTGSTVDRIPLEDFPTYEILWPGEALVEVFSAVAKPLRQRGERAEAESRTLAALRDTLLPALFSGEITIKNAETIVGKAV